MHHIMDSLDHLKGVHVKWAVEIKILNFYYRTVRNLWHSRTFYNISDNTEGHFCAFQGSNVFAGKMLLAHSHSDPLCMESRHSILA